VRNHLGHISTLPLCVFLTGEKPSRSHLYTFYLNELLTQLTRVVEAPSLEGADINNGRLLLFVNIFILLFY